MIGYEYLIEKIFDAKDAGRTSFRFTNSELSVIPEDVFSITSLRILDLSHNQIKEIPKKISDLTNLEVLVLKSNNIHEISPNLRLPSKLRIFDVRDNEIKELPKFIFSEINIGSIYVGKKKDDENPYSLFDSCLAISNNPIQKPPLEILSRGVASVRNYFDEIESKTSKLYEAKLLIVGEGGAGKTTLANKLIDINYELVDSELTTKGIDISRITFSYLDEEFKVNIWDFGGQEIYYSTHQFFLTRRSLYILLSDSRKEDTDFNYWLSIIDLLSENSPVIIVSNEKQDRKKRLNEKAIRSKFPNVREFIESNLATNRGVEDVIREVKHNIVKLSHVGSELPQTWVDIRHELEQLNKDYISLDAYYEICRKHSVLGTKKALYLSEFFHDLGVCLHFQDNRVLKKYVILKPSWGTNAVYKLLDDDDVINNKGKFSLKDADRIWSSVSFENMHHELIELMIKFELCYETDKKSDEFIIPQLLEPSKPDYEWISENNLNLYLIYNFFPKGVLTRFIVRMNRFIQNEKYVWKEGVVLFRDDTYAEIIQVFGEERISIKIQGRFKKELLVIIIEEFDHIHSYFEDIVVHKMIPCICNECKASLVPHFYKYSSLRERVRRNKKKVECEISYLDVQVSELIESSVGSKVMTHKKILSEKSKILDFIKLGEVGKALQASSDIFHATKSLQLQKSLNSLMGKEKRTHKRYLSNVIGVEKYEKELGNVSNNLMILLDMISEDDYLDV